MELAMWIGVGLAAGLAGIALIPILVVGTWFVIMTSILGLADGVIWLLDQGWKKNKQRTRTGLVPSFGGPVLSPIKISSR